MYVERERERDTHSCRPEVALQEQVPGGEPVALPRGLLTYR